MKSIKLLGIDLEVVEIQWIASYNSFLTTFTTYSSLIKLRIINSSYHLEKENIHFFSFIISKWNFLRFFKELKLKHKFFSELLMSFLLSFTIIRSEEKFLGVFPIKKNKSTRELMKNITFYYLQVFYFLQYSSCETFNINNCEMTCV